MIIVIIMNNNNKDDNSNNSDNSSFNVKFVGDWPSSFFHVWYFQSNNSNYEFEKLMWPNIVFFIFYLIVYFFYFIIHY